MSQKKKKSAGSFWMPIIVVGMFIVAIIAFAFQTWFLVDTIFPSDNLFMKVATVCSLDLMSIIFAATEMFYPFRTKDAKHLCFGMWLVTFILALLASIIYLYLNSLNVLHGIVDTRILALAYGIVLVAMSADIIAITVGIRMEWNAAHPEDDAETQTGVLRIEAKGDDSQTMYMDRATYDRLMQQVNATHVSPLASPASLAQEAQIKAPDNSKNGKK